MKQLEVHLPSGNYDVLIGQGILSTCGERIRKTVGGKKVFLITDDQVAKIYLKQVVATLEQAEYVVYTHVFPAGEASKTPERLFLLWQDMAKARILRSDVCVALGGGVVGDIAGFAASTYLRGIPFVQIPTTVLSQIDSSIGGKVAVDLPQGKNLAGAFYQPSLVLCDTDTLCTLSDVWFFDGCAEAIKYGAIADDALFCMLEDHHTRCEIQENIEEIVIRCLAIKRKLVEQDERDTGARMILNFGHTLGHTMEYASEYRLPHGHAVAAGMVLMASFAEQNFGVKPEILQRIKKLVGAMGLPIDGSGYDVEKMIEALSLDKKAESVGVRTVQVTQIGACDLVMVSIDVLSSYIKSLAV